MLQRNATLRDTLRVARHIHDMVGRGKFERRHKILQQTFRCHFAVSGSLPAVACLEHVHLLVPHVQIERVEDVLVCRTAGERGTGRRVKRHAQLNWIRWQADEAAQWLVVAQLGCTNARLHEHLKVVAARLN